MADTLSRAPIHRSDTDTSDLQEEAEYLMEMCVNSLPANSHRLEEFSKAQKQILFVQPLLVTVKMNGQRNQMSP